ncbi:hypothetical protein BU24DRAFT_413266 [Aaosphaeria arxii CBS 175.79]|uniref:Uncharacterized protein n=1 Tax=Aaosphaeria arxii CBS 175.79 TaxID=1450172 RepID=A0A6A5XFM5_9PLEO|nr:uncharacterized protein BU24DRAFT_413266 [Aaosphaeria arxii CBS 175.79]KAF2011631.1 hypothetical protein BU24DRAFT_413266 [Aaosphaeria arxii CBS 175.79]
MVVKVEGGDGRRVVGRGGSVGLEVGGAGGVRLVTLDVELGRGVGVGLEVGGVGGVWVVTREEELGRGGTGLEVGGAGGVRVVTLDDELERGGIGLEVGGRIVVEFHEGTVAEIVGLLHELLVTLDDELGRGGIGLEVGGRRVVEFHEGTVAESDGLLHELLDVGPGLRVDGLHGIETLNEDAGMENEVGLVNGTEIRLVDGRLVGMIEMLSDRVGSTGGERDGQDQLEVGKGTGVRDTEVFQPPVGKDPVMKVGVREGELGGATVTFSDVDRLGTGTDQVGKAVGRGIGVRESEEFQGMVVGTLIVMIGGPVETRDVAEGRGKVAVMDGTLIVRERLSDGKGGTIDDNLVDDESDTDGKLSVALMDGNGPGMEMFTDGKGGTMDDNLEDDETDSDGNTRVALTDGNCPGMVMLTDGNGGTIEDTLDEDGINTDVIGTDALTVGTVIDLEIFTDGIPGMIEDRTLDEEGTTEDNTLDGDGTGIEGNDSVALMDGNPIDLEIMVDGIGGTTMSVNDSDPLTDEIPGPTDGTPLEGTGTKTDEIGVETALVGIGIEMLVGKGGNVLVGSEGTIEKPIDAGGVETMGTVRVGPADDTTGMLRLGTTLEPDAESDGIPKEIEGTMEGFNDTPTDCEGVGIPGGSTKVWDTSCASTPRAKPKAAATVISNSIFYFLAVPVPIQLAGYGGEIGRFLSVLHCYSGTQLRPLYTHNFTSHHWDCLGRQV